MAKKKAGQSSKKKNENQTNVDGNSNHATVANQDSLKKSQGKKNKGNQQHGKAKSKESTGNSKAVIGVVVFVLAAAVAGLGVVFQTEIHESSVIVYDEYIQPQLIKIQEMLQGDGQEAASVKERSLPDPDENNNDIDAENDERQRQEEEKELQKQREEEKLRKQEEERIRKQKEEEKLRKQKEEEEKLRKQKEEEEKLRKQREEEEKIRKQKEEEEKLRKQKEEEEKLRKQKEEEEKLRKQKEEEEKLRKQKEEEEKLRKQKEEEEKLRKQKEEEEKQRKQKEEEEKIRKQEEEKLRKQKEEEEKLRKQKEEEKKQKQQEEERKQKQREDEEKRKKQEEELKRKQAEEEDNKRKQQEEEEKKRKQQEDEKKRQQEEEKKRKQKEDEEKKRKQQEEEEKKRKQEEEEKKRKQEEEEKKRKQEEEEKKRKQEEEEKKRKQQEEEEKKRKQQEEEEKKRIQKEKEETQKKDAEEKLRKQKEEEREKLKKDWEEKQQKPKEEENVNTGEKPSDKSTSQKKAKPDNSERNNYHLASITGDDDWKIHKELDEADELREKDELEKALRKYDALLIQSTSPRAFYGKGLTLDKLGFKFRSNQHLEDAIKVMSQVLDLDDVPPEMVKLAGRKVAERQQFRGWGQESVRTFKKLVQRYPEDLALRGEMGQSYMMQGMNERAKDIFKEILARSPEDGFAKAHMGFIMKTEGSGDLQGAVKMLRDGVNSGAPGTQDGRFYLHLGDSLLRLNQEPEAREVYQTAADKGLFLSAWQRSLYNVDTLTGRPWWTPEQTGYQSYFKMLQDNWQVIREEGLSQLNAKTGGFLPEDENLRDTGDWKQLTLFQQGRKNAANCKRTPKTCELIEKFPAALNCRRGQVKFSVMSPGIHVWPHTGPTNCRIRSHLGLVVPQGPLIRVTDETRRWTEGEFLIFDDSFEHEVWHEGSELRLVLIVDVWHPELTESQRRTLSPI